ncbi:MAG: hypothetical protein M0C28_02150 [Candidatus Moduliflexus flocculans]|nr:hypothetical protein [Candidatus Moduliflexus flocculans]
MPGHQPLTRAVTVTRPGSGSGVFFFRIQRGGSASSVNGFQRRTCMPTESAFL